MVLIDWFEELKNLEMRALGLGEFEDKAILSESISKVIFTPLIALRPDKSIEEAYRELNDRGIDAALVKENSEILVGVIRKDALKRALLSGRVSSKRLSIAEFMDRNITLEPTDTAVVDILTRFTRTDCSHIVLIDALGWPCRIVSPKNLCLALNDYFPAHHHGEKVGIVQNGVGELRMRSIA